LPLIFEALDHQTPIDVVAAKNDRSVIAIDYREIKLAVKIACGLHQGTAGLCEDAYESICERFLHFLQMPSCHSHLLQDCIAVFEPVMAEQTD
jgi:hypothetical protein